MEYIRLVKGAVIRSVESIDTDVQITDTGHFNHSAHPDLILKWRNRGVERPMFLRRSYAEMVASGALERKADAAVIMSVGSGGKKESRPRRAVERGLGMEGQRDSLVTDSAALDRLVGTDDATSRSPLMGAVASQIFPAGQGFLNESRAAVVASPTDTIVDDLREVLRPEAVASLEVVANVVASAVTGEVPEDQRDRQFVGHEVRDLLPWLLTDDSVTRDADFWEYIASNISLKSLEESAELLEGVDLTPLCGPGHRTWTALRAALGVSEMQEGEPDPGSVRWYLRGRNLVCEVGDAAFRFTTYGQSIRSAERAAVSSATWERVSSQFAEGSRLRRVVLRGLVRSITVGAEESLDVAEDVRSVLDSVNDQYYVDELVLQYGLSGDDRTVRLSLGEQIAYNLGSATVRDLMMTLSGPGAYRSPVDLSVLDLESE